MKELMQVFRSKRGLASAFILCTFSIFLSASTLNTLEVSNEEMQRRLSLFAYNAPTSGPSEKQIETHSKYNIYKAHFWGYDPITSEDMKVSFFKYAPSNRNGKRSPYVLIIPNIKGITLVEINAAKFFARRGITAFILGHHDYLLDPTRPLAAIQALIRRSTVAVRSLIDIIEGYDSIISEKSALLGVSLGGIRAAHVMSVDLRIKSAALVVAGDNLPEIILKSDQEDVVRFRKSRMKQENLNKAQFFQRLDEEIGIIDTNVFSSRRDSRDFFMILSTNDTYVPTKNQLSLYKSLGKPKNFYRVGTDHILTSLSTGLYLKRILRFYLQHWTGKVGSTIFTNLLPENVDNNIDDMTNLR